jgi:prevent-host-death family protein
MPSQGRAAALTDSQSWRWQKPSNRPRRIRIDLHDHLDYNDLRIEGPDMTTSDATTSVWTVAEAKAKLSEVIERAQSTGPQAITRNGRKAVVVVAAEEWERKTKRVGNLAEFFAASPLRGSGLKIKRMTGRLRKLDL